MEINGSASGERLKRFEIRARPFSYPGTAWSRLASWIAAKNLSREFWRFLAASFFFDSGLFIFFLLYNLYLLDLGFREDFLGWTAGALALGGIAGSLPGGYFAYRFGLRKALLVCVFFVPIGCVLRATVDSGPWLLCLAFGTGFVVSLWAIALPPVVTQVTDDKNRAFAFSFIFAAGIGFGSLAGVVGGYLPKWLAFVPPAAGHNRIRAALLLACGLTALALWPVSRLKLDSIPVPEKRLLPRNGFVPRFFLALAVWSFAAGAFTPFFNAYLAHGLRMPAERIGAIFGAAQLVQAVGVLLAPIVFQRIGMINGIASTQIAAAIALVWLAASSGGWNSAVAYVSYTGFLWMSEPGMYTLLMNNVGTGERAGAASLNLLVVSGAQAISASAAGAAFLRFGYPTTMVAIACTMLTAACVFRLFVTNGGHHVRIRQIAKTELYL